MMMAPDSNGGYASFHNDLATTAIPAVIMHAIIASVDSRRRRRLGRRLAPPVLPLARKSESREPLIALAARDPVARKHADWDPDPPSGEVDKKAGSRVRPVERNPTHRIERYGGCRVPNIAAKCRRLLQSGGRPPAICSLKSATTLACATSDDVSRPAAAAVVGLFRIGVEPFTIKLRTRWSPQSASLLAPKHLCIVDVLITGSRAQEYSHLSG
jgi:hypothetical protein